MNTITLTNEQYQLVIFALLLYSHESEKTLNTVANNLGLELHQAGRNRALKARQLSDQMINSGDNNNG